MLDRPWLLLHGHPRTFDLASRGSVAGGPRPHMVCVDLPGYGRSDKPAPTADHRPHAKRAGARHLLAAMNSLGHHQFDLVGHDRGSYYALR
ncbi:MAG: alpha/beta fold hydrolase, partial [Propionibacteriaceae bacterium]